MVRIIYLISLLLMMQSVWSFDLRDTIDAENLKSIVLEKGLFDKINAYRTSQSVKPLIFNQIVHKAARDHSEYLKDRDSLSHEQGVPGKVTVQQRVNRYLKTRRLITGENIARIAIQRPTLVYGTDGKAEPGQIWTYEEAVDALFHAWKQSTVHKKNMLNEMYSITAISVSYDSVNQRLTVVQVFAHVG